MIISPADKDYRCPKKIMESVKLTPLEKIITIFLFNNFTGDLTVEKLSKFTGQELQVIKDTFNNLTKIGLLECNEETIFVKPQWVTVNGWTPSIKKTNKKKMDQEFVKPTMQEFKRYFFDKGYELEVAERAYEGYNAADWKDVNGKQIKNWKQKAANSWFKPENKRPILKNEGSGGVAI